VPNLTEQAFRFKLAPTTAQDEFLSSCAGASRFWFNQGLALVKARLDERSSGQHVVVPWSYEALCSEIEKRRRAELAPWQSEVVCGCYQAGFEALGNWERVFACESCRHEQDRDLNAALNLARAAQLCAQAQGSQCHVAAAGAETLNARGGHVRPAPRSRQRPLKREGLAKRSSQRRKTPVSPRENYHDRRQERSSTP
jgi:transposase